MWLEPEPGSSLTKCRTKGGSGSSNESCLQSLLQLFEENLADAGQDDSAGDYDGTRPESEWSQAQEGDRDPSVPDRAETRAAGPRSRLQDLLLATRKRASSCFGARMDRIGNASSLGCNNGRGEKETEDLDAGSRPTLPSEPTLDPLRIQSGNE